MNFRICLTDFIWYTIMYFLMLGLILVELCKVTPHEDGDSHHDDGVGIYTVLPHGVLTDIRQFFWRLSHFLLYVGWWGGERERGRDQLYVQAG